jgi:hypothetical protein
MIAAACTVDKQDIFNELAHECTARGASTELAIEAKTRAKEVTLPPEYQRFASVFSEEESQRFLPSRTWDHAITLKNDAPEAINCKVYPMMRTEDKALDDFLDKQLAKGYIRPSISPYASSFFFIKKKDGKLCPVQEYWTLNKWTVRNQYPLPLVMALIRDLGGAHIYTKLDVRWGYNNVWIKEGDEYKAAPQRVTSTALQLAVDHAFTGSYVARFRPSDPPETLLCPCGAPLRTPQHLTLECCRFFQHRLNSGIYSFHRTLRYPQLYASVKDAHRLLAFLQSSHAAFQPETSPPIPPPPEPD